jgi:chaperonin cofactor prefoldin
MNKRLADSVAKILYEDTKTKLTKDNIKDSTARVAASILETPIVSKKLDQSGPQKSAAEILYESIIEKSQSQDSAARIAAQILKTSPVTTQMIGESGSVISDALNFEPKIKTKYESIFYNKKRKEISEEVKHEIEALESKFETLENTLAEDLRKYKQNITEAVSTTKTNYAGTDSGGGEVRLLAMDDVETKMMNKQARVSYLANNVSLTYDTNDKLFHFRYAYNQNLLQSSNVIFNNIDTTGNINVGGTAFVSYDITGNSNLIVTGNTNIGKNLIVSGNTIIQGNLLVTGNTTTLNVTNLSVKDALIYLNDTSTSTNLDIGVTGNYNDGAYKHAGLFRDSNDGVWKFFDGYTPELNVATKILTTDPSYVDAGLKVGNFTANGNLTVTKAVTITGNLSAGNISTTGALSAGVMSVTGNLSAGNVNTLGVSNVGTSIVTTLTASKPVFTDANKALTSSGTMPTNQGGTGLTSFTSGGAVYASSTSALTTGTLPTASGGTGLTSFTANGLVYASSTSALATGSTLQFDGTNFGVGLTPVVNNGVLQLGSYASIKSLVESATITGAAPSATTQFDWMSQAVQYYTSNATTNFTLNIRGNGSTSLNTVMQVGQSASIALMVTNGSPAYYMSAINIDSTASGVTVKYINGTSLSSGNANSIDIYNITVIKTASATYTVLVVQAKFA